MNLRPLLATLMLTSVTSPALAGPTAKVDNFARHTLNLSGYKWAEFDLNGDGRPEQFLYANDPNWCGSGGCTLFILQLKGNSFRRVSHTTVTQLPIAVLQTTTHRWHDLAVTVSGGGVRPGRVRLSYNGQKYSSNPTLAPRIRDIGGLLKVLIAQ